MDIITAYHTKNSCYIKGTPLTPTGIVVHSTGANNPNLSRYVDAPDEVGVNKYGNHWNRSSVEMNRSVCVHAFIGYDKDKNVRVANILPYNIACWGCGSGKNGSFNKSHIQFEMCEDGLTDPKYFAQVYAKAVEYSAYLCKKFNLDPLGKNVIVSHKESHALGYGNNHGDPHNWFKNHGKTMDDFRQDVAKAANGESVKTEATSDTLYAVQVGAFKNRSNAENLMAQLKKAGFEGFIVTKCVPKTT